MQFVKFSYVTSFLEQNSHILMGILKTLMWTMKNKVKSKI